MMIPSVSVVRRNARSVLNNKCSRETKGTQGGPRETKVDQGTEKETKRYQGAPRGTKRNQGGPRATKEGQGEFNGIKGDHRNQEKYIFL